MTTGTVSPMPPMLPNAKARPIRWRGLPLAAAGALSLLCGTASIALLGCGAANAAANVVTLDRSELHGKHVTLGLDKSIVVDLPADAYDILVANPTVADAVTRTPRRIYLFGKQVGQTNIFVFGADGTQIASLDIQIERDTTDLVRQLKKYIPDSDIHADMINDNVVLSGTVQTPEDSTRAAEIAHLFVTGGQATTGQYAITAAGGSSSNGVAISNPDQQRQTSAIVNLLKIIGENQVTLKVTVAEVQRSVMKQLGVNFIANASTNGMTFSSVGEQIAGAIGKPLSYSGAGLAGTIGSATIDSYVNAMELAGVMKTLAEPTLTAVSGETATFRVGGDYNVISGSDVSTDSNGKTKITYNFDHQLQYGIGLEFKPVVLSAGRISLKIRTTVSEPTTEQPVTLSVGASNGQATSTLSIRRRLADTTVELPSGGSMMIAGLLSDDVRQTVSGFPGLRRIPVLGALFRDRDYVRNESELVVIVTPYLVRPVARDALARPDDNFNPAGDAAGYLLGRVNRVYGTANATPPNGRYNGVVGFIYQ
jgi:pilus assembly protein CpaC